MAYGPYGLWPVACDLWPMTVRTMDHSSGPWPAADCDRSGFVTSAYGCRIQPTPAMLTAELAIMPHTKVVCRVTVVPPEATLKQACTSGTCDTEIVFQQGTGPLMAYGMTCVLYHGFLGIWSGAWHLACSMA